MWIYFVTLVALWIFRKVHAEYTKAMDVDVSKNSVPLVKNSINALGMTSGTKVQANLVLSATNDNDFQKQSSSMIAILRRNSKGLTDLAFLGFKSTTSSGPGMLKKC